MPSLNIRKIFIAINMTNEDWEASRSAPIMLAGLYLQDPVHFDTLTPILHRYFLACCWKWRHFIPQDGLRDGLIGAQKWIDGLLSDEDFSKLDYYSEAEAFAFENVDTPERIQRLKTLIASIDALQEAEYDIAHQILKEAAYFTVSAIIYPKICQGPYVESLCTSRFLCPDLLRQFLRPRFNGSAHKGSLDVTTV